MDMYSQFTEHLIYCCEWCGTLIERTDCSEQTGNLVPNAVAKIDQFWTVCVDNYLCDKGVFDEGNFGTMDWFGAVRSETPE